MNFRSGNNINFDNSTLFNDIIDGNKQRVFAYYGNLDGLRDYSGNNLLHVAVTMGNLDIIKYLLEQKVSVSLKNKFNKTPWDYALASSCKNIIKLFYDNENNLIATCKNLSLNIKQLEDNIACANTEIVILKRNNKRLRDENTTIDAKNSDLVNENKRLKASNENMMKTFKR